MESRPQRTGPSRTAFVLLSILTVISLLLNLALLALAGVAYWRVSPLLEAASGLGRSLREAVEEPLALEFPIRRTVPIQIELPVKTEIEFAIDRNIPVDSAFELDVTLPVVGRISETIPIHFEIPFRIEIPIIVSSTVPVSVAVPLSLTVPISINLQDLPIGEDLSRVGRALEELVP